eukprot:jgi/Undpi1/10245/HiC_scaffold_28.g12698.m1
MQRRQRQRAEGVKLSVPVAFSKHLNPEDAAFLLAEVLRHVLFIRGQLPMPYRQLLKTLEEREERDRVAAEEAAAARVSQEAGAGEGEAGSRLRSAAFSKKRVKGGRSLARAPAHRRARKALTALEETTASIEQAFADAARKNRPVLEALILLGASHLSPREIYSVIFPGASAGVCGDLAGVCAGRSDGGSGRGARGKISVDACSRKLVRCLVGGMSGVTFRGLGSCRVHIFLRIADAPVRDLHVLHAIPAASANLASTEVRVSRSRPAPKVSIVLSNVPASNSQVQACPNRGGAGGSVLGESPRQGQPKVEGGGDGCRTVEVSSEEGMKRGRCVENEEGGRGGGGGRAPRGRGVASACVPQAGGAEELRQLGELIARLLPKRNG